MHLLKNLNWKPFLISFVAIFFMVLLPKLGLDLSKLKIPTLFYTILSNETYTNFLNPQPSPIDHFENIKPRLQNTPNDFKVKKTSQLITPAQAEGEYQDAVAYGLIDLDTGKIITDKNLTKTLPIASLTKIMTAVVALDLAREDELLTVSKYSTTMIPSKVFLKPGEKLTITELLDCFMLSSANDCAEATANGIDQKYGDRIFIKAMNEKANFIGLKNTYFTNPQGFDKGNPYSTVEDLMILSHYALKNYPTINEIVQKPSEELLENENHGYYHLNNWNGLLGIYPGAYGIKIGYTENASYTTVVVSEREDKKILAVVLGAPGVLERDLYASQLLDLGFSILANLDPVELTQTDLRAKYATWQY